MKTRCILSRAIALALTLTCTGGGYWLAYINRATCADWQKIPTPFWVATSLSLAVVAIIFVFIVRRVFTAQRQDIRTTPGTPAAA